MNISGKRVDVRRFQAREELRRIVTAIAKDQATADAACRCINDAVEDYGGIRQLGNESRVLPSVPKTSETRAALNRLKKTMQASLDAAHGLPPSAALLLSQAGDDSLDEIANDVGLDDAIPDDDESASGQPVGRLLRDLAAALAAVERACMAAEELPNRQADHGRAVLACQIALVVRDGLGKKPTRTRYVEGDENPNDGALYARLMHFALQASGLFQVDEAAIQDAGLRLLKQMPGKGNRV